MNKRFLLTFEKVAFQTGNEYTTCHAHFWGVLNSIRESMRCFNECQCKELAEPLAWISFPVPMRKHSTKVTA